jgi:hypothetical protein
MPPPIRIVASALIAVILGAALGVSVYLSLLSSPSTSDLPPRPPAGAAPNEAFCLDDDDAATAHLEAAAGNRYAADSLYWHYCYCLNRTKGAVWLHVAADLGLARAQYNLGIHYSELGESDVSKALLLSAHSAAVGPADLGVAENAIRSLCTLHGLTPMEVTALTSAPNPGVQRTRYARR